MSANFIVRTYSYTDLPRLETELNNLAEDYEPTVIEPMETFIFVVMKKK